MKKLGLALTLLMLIWGGGVATAQNIFTNGDFAKGEAPWFLWNDDGVANMKVVDGQMVIKSTRWGAKNWSSQVCYKGILLEKGATYKLSFDAYATMERDWGWRFQKDGGNYDGYAGDDVIVKLGTAKKHYEYTFKMNNPTDPKTAFCLNVGKPNKDAGKSTLHEIYFDNFKLEKVN